MTSVFITILNMSITASVVALAVILVRMPLKKAPKIFSYALWGVVLFRLVCPYNIITNFSLMPIPFETIPQNIVYSQNPETQASAGLGDVPAYPDINNALPPVIPDNINPIVPENNDPIINAETNPEKFIPAEPENNTNIIYTLFNVTGYVWLFGFFALLSYATVGYVRLKRRVYYATLIRDNIYETDTIKTPFVLGFFDPKIYMPIGIDPAQHDYIVKHEQTHIRRYDYIIKPLAFIVFALHWFNPLMWAAYYFMSRDIEMSCDEAVLRKADADIRDVYSSALLNLSVKRGGLLTPLAFGESAVKGRVKNVLNFKKPSRTISVVAIALVAVLSVGFAVNGTNGASGNELLEFEVVFSNVTEYSREDHFKLGDRLYSGYIVNGQVQTANIRGLKEVGYAFDDFGRYRIFERPGYSIEEFIIVRDYGLMNPATIYVASIPSEIEPLETVSPPNTYLPQIMHDGVLYYLDSKVENDIEFELTEDTPRIKTTVPLTQIPQENGQANFGDVDAPYVVFEDGLYVLWNNKWTHFISFVQLTSSEQRNMTLADVRTLAAKGLALTEADLEPYYHEPTQTGIFFAVYLVDGGDFVFGYHPFIAGEYEFTLSQAEDLANGIRGIDIRYYDVDKYIADGTRELVRPLPEPPQYEVGNVTAISNGIEYEPYTHIYFSENLTINGMVSTERLPLSLEEAASILPEIQIADDFNILVSGRYVTRVMYSLYDDKFNIIYDRENNYSSPAGTGVYMLCVYVIWSNSEIEQQNREAIGLQYVFKVST